MAAVRLISAFLQQKQVGSSPTSGQDMDASTSSVSTSADDEASQLLCQRLNLLANIDLPPEAKLAELEALSATGMAQGIF